jgi:hypothetical protein
VGWHGAEPRLHIRYTVKSGFGERPEHRLPVVAIPGQVQEVGGQEASVTKSEQRSPPALSQALCRKSLKGLAPEATVTFPWPFPELTPAPRSMGALTMLWVKANPSGLVTISMKMSMAFNISVRMRSLPCTLTI